MFKTMMCSVFILISMCTNADDSASANVRDPTSPLGFISKSESVVGAPQFDLSSILISPSRKLAFINGNALREGQTVPGADNVKVQRITRQEVVLQQVDKTWVLKLSPNIVKRH